MNKVFHSNQVIVKGPCHLFLKHKPQLPLDAVRGKKHSPQ